MDRARVARSAAAHHGVLLPELLDQEGVTPRQRQRRVSNGEWRRLGGGVLAVASAPMTFELRALAALIAMPDAALSHQSAACVLATGLTSPRLHLSGPPDGTNRLAGAVIHQTNFAVGDVVQRGLFRVTSIDRTLVDLGSELGRTELQRLIEDQLVARTTTLSRVEATFHRLSGSGRPGTTRVRKILSDLDGVPPTESELEAVFVRLLRRHWLPQAVRQVRFDWQGSERGRVDFWYPQQRLIVELDGRRFHQRSDAFERDRRRDQLALVDGVRTVRFTHRQVSSDAEFVAGVVRSLLEGDRSSGDRRPQR